MKRLLSILITVAMLVSLTAVLSVSAFAQSEPWNGVDIANGYVGEGTEESPYLISTAAELEALSIDAGMLGETFEGKYIKLTDDINLGGNQHTAIAGFKGNFDGNGKTVFNFTVDEPKAGLFGKVGTGATIKNVKVDYATITCTGDRVGGIVAETVADVVVENCEVGENVLITTMSTAGVAPQAGGVVGMAIGASFKNLVNRAQIVVNVENCGNVSAFIGGIFGSAGNSAVCENLINYGDIVCNLNTLASGKYATCGGIVGSAGAKKLQCDITNAINYGAVRSTGSVGTAGGLIGLASGVSNSDVATAMKNVFNLNADIVAPDGVGFFAGQMAKTVSFAGTCLMIGGSAIENIAGVIGEGIAETLPPSSAYAMATSEIDFSVNADYLAVLSIIDEVMPKWAAVEDIDYDPNVPADSTPADSTPADSTPSTPADSTPAESTPSTPADSGTVEAPVDTNPQTPAQTQKPSAGTEKPADDGGCGSVIASGLAIVAVVSLAGVALSKKRD